MLYNFWAIIMNLCHYAAYIDTLYAPHDNSLHRVNTLLSFSAHAMVENSLPYDHVVLD